MKKIIWFNTKLIQSGGGERFGLEVIKSLSSIGIDSSYLAYHYKSELVFDGLYDQLSIDSFSCDFPKVRFRNPISRRAWLIRRRLWLRKKIKEMQPDLIVTTGTWSQVSEVYLSTIGLNVNYVVHIFGSLFAFPPERENTKYARIFRKNFSKIRDSLETYKNFVPEKNPERSLRRAISNEVSSVIKYLAVRKASKIFVLSERNKKETFLLYDKKAIVLKGAFPKNIFDYVPATDVKTELGLQGKKILLSICRLSSNKRVDLIIKSFAIISQTNPDTVLLIGGTGSEESYLRLLVKDLCLGAQVKFIGYVPDAILWDYMHGCDVFMSLDLADFDIAPLEALALGSRVIWSDEMELDEVEENLPGYVFSVDSDINSIAKTIDCCIHSTDVQAHSSEIREFLTQYSWETYSRNMIKLFTGDE